MDFFGIEQKDGVVRIPGPVEMPSLDWTTLAGLQDALDLKLDAADYTAADVLAKLITVDGAGSGLDADTLDGQSSAAFAAAVHTHAQAEVTGLTAALALKLDATSYTAADVLAKLLTVDGAGSGLDADLLDGNSSAAFLQTASYQALAPTWTQPHTFTTGVGSGTYPIVMSSGTPGLVWIESDQAVDERRADSIITGKSWRFRFVSDDGATVANILNLVRGTGVALSGIQIGNPTDNPTYSFLGTGTATFSGQVTALRFVPTSSTIPTNGLYIPGTNNPAIAANSTKVLDITATATNVTGNLSLTTAGNKLLVKEGTNASMGVATLVAGAATVNTTLVSANSRIFLSGQNSSGTHGELTISARVAGTSFTISSTSATDTRSVAWMIVEPA